MPAHRLPPQPLRAMRGELSDIIHGCAVDALGFPAEKRFHRFIPLADGDFIHPGDRSERYTVIEILMFEGRSVEDNKRFIRLLYERACERLQLEPMDLELIFVETPRHDWGIRGLPGDELELSYRVNVYSSSPLRRAARGASVGLTCRACSSPISTVRCSTRARSSAVIRGSSSWNCSRPACSSASPARGASIP